MVAGVQQTIVNPDQGDVVRLINPAGQARIVLVCEHASHRIPAEYDNLGLSDDALASHVAWDPGALGVAERLSQQLDAPLVVQQVSRLVYDCNRAPGAESAMPEKSEIYDIPGNKNLSGGERARRKAAYYEPFRNMVATLINDRMAQRALPDLITIHSFTPVFLGKQREVEIGILHDDDTRLADLLLASATGDGTFDVRRNAPYGPGDNVMHTLREHALPLGLPNIMIEVRNDLIADAEAQKRMADWLLPHILRASSGIARPTIFTDGSAAK